MNIQNLIGLTTGSPSTTLGPQSISPLRTGTDDQSTVSTETSPASIAAIAPNETAEEFETFLTLLTAQIRNQDPLAPLDSTQFVEQLATFSALELQAESNQKLDQIAFLLAQQNNDA